MSTIFNYKNTSIHFTSTGKGKVVVLLHGFLENLTMWNAIVPELVKKSRIICIDLLGHGKSKNLGYIHTMEEQAKMVKALLSHLRLRKYTLIGHSMGGYIALAFAELFPKTIKGLCLMNSTALADTETKKINRDRAIKAVKQNHKTFVRIAIPNLFSEENRDIFKTEIKQIAQEALQTSIQSIVASLEGMKIRKDRTELFQKASYPKGLILGKKDPVLAIEIHAKLAESTDVKLVELPDGHMSHIENKEALIIALKGFVKICV
ncbi:MAG TPA: alpha/beta hydrolase [Flavobacteriaceae bacterium]|jgi:pimeloyl-ACP methyl ester carboxylesterase|nr:alpha/beta hydrolase [Flavobacteriaceae bacterium]